MKTPKKVGRYVVKSLLGQGAMGFVYKAYDPSIQREVAIKTIKLDPNYDDQDTQSFYERFRQEVKISGHLNHPGIVAIFDVGEQDSLPFLAMEYVDGQTLLQVLRERQSLSFEYLLHIIDQIASALDFAHSKGITHRDLKPGNIMVTTNGSAKIMDFGIAKLEGSNLTQTGTFLGTPSYCSPEQVKGGKVDHRSDIFSLGILAHEVLTGKLPFVGKSINTVLYRIVHEPWEPAPNLNELPVNTTSWRLVFDKVLDKAPTQRYQSAGEFAQALQACPIENQDSVDAPTVQFDLGHVNHETESLASEKTENTADEQQTGSTASELKAHDSFTPETIHEIPVKPKTSPWLILLTLLVIAGLGGGLYVWKDNIFPATTLPSEEPQTTGASQTQQEPSPQTAAKEPPTETLPADQASPVVHRWFLESEPSGASIFLNHNTEPVGATPFSHTWKAKPGAQLHMKFVHEGFHEEEVTVVFTEDLSRVYTVAMTPQTTERTLTSEPSGATVWIAGKAQGKTPLTYAFTYGLATSIELRKDGYYDQKQTYKEGKTPENKLKFKFVAVPPPGQLIVEPDISMDGLKLYINDKKQSGYSLKLKEGTYRVRMEAPHYFYKEVQQVRVVSGQTTKLKTPVIISIPKLQSIGGYVQVKIDGWFVKNESQKIDTTPLAKLKIAAGSHHFEYVRDQKVVMEETREILRSEPIIITLKNAKK